MKRRIIATVLSLVLLASLLPVSALAATTHSHDGVAFDTVLTEIDSRNNSLDEGNYYLTGDVTYSGTSEKLFIDGTVNLCLNGYTLSMGNTTIMVGSGDTLNICDCTDTTNDGTTGGMISSIAHSTIWVYASELADSAAYLHGGTIRNNYSSSLGSGVRTNGSGECRGDFEMDGGCVEGYWGILCDTRGDVTVAGGTVKGSDGSMHMNGSSTSGYHSIVHISGGTFLNTVRLAYDAHLYLSGSPTFDCGDEADIWWYNGQNTVSRKRLIYAGYTGEPLEIELQECAEGMVLIYGCTDTSKFTLYNNTEGYTVQTADGNLILHKDHSWDEGVVTKNATTETTGEMLYTCTVCQETKTEEIPVLNIEVGVSISDHADITVTEPEGGWFLGTNSFTVSSETAACYVAVSYDGGQTYTRLEATAGENGYSFTAEDMDTGAILAVGYIGDINGDGKMSTADYNMARAMVLGKVDGTALQIMAADTNCDGKITMAEYATLRAVSLGKVNFNW